MGIGNQDATTICRRKRMVERAPAAWVSSGLPKRCLGAGTGCMTHRAAWIQSTEYMSIAVNVSDHGAGGVAQPDM